MTKKDLIKLLEGYPEDVEIVGIDRIGRYSGGLTFKQIIIAEDAGRLAYYDDTNEWRFIDYGLNPPPVKIIKCLLISIEKEERNYGG